jgi:ubiquinone/menaquinone biosynthesis C-methylase UbiE
MSFDTLAPHYRWMEFVLAGEKLQRCRTRFLDEISSAQNILLLGEGHGRCLIECCRRFSGAQITCVDSSGKMLVQARRQLARQNSRERVEFVHADILQWKPSAKTFDLVVTNFFLDCFRADQLEQITTKLALATTSDANWLIADFQTASSGWKRLRSQMILASMYLFFRTIAGLPARKLTTLDPILKRAGFALHRRAESEWDRLHSDWWKRTRVSSMEK